MFGVNPLMGVDEARASAASPPDEATGDATDMVDDVAGGVVTEVETTDCRFVLGGMLFTTLLLLLLRTLLVVIMEAGIVVVVVVVVVVAFVVVVVAVVVVVEVVCEAAGVMDALLLEDVD